MGTRLELQIVLEELLGTRNVYFQSTESVKMQYPAIVYSRSNIETRHANDRPYNQSRVYQVTLIDKNPDSKFVDKIAQLPMCRFDRHYKADNLNHDVFTLYF